MLLRGVPVSTGKHVRFDKNSQGGRWTVDWWIGVWFEGGEGGGGGDTAGFGGAGRQVIYKLFIGRYPVHAAHAGRANGRHIDKCVALQAPARPCRGGRWVGGAGEVGRWRR